MAKDILVPIDPNFRPCSICGKEFEKSPIIVPDGDLCPECKRKYSGMAFVYCKKCRRIVVRVGPGMAANGLLVKPGDILHVDECPKCNPKVVTSIPDELK